MSEENKIFDKLFENASCTCSSGGYDEPRFQCESCWIISYESGQREEIQSLRAMIIEARPYLRGLNTRVDLTTNAYEFLKDWLEKTKDIKVDNL